MKTALSLTSSFSILVVKDTLDFREKVSFQEEVGIVTSYGTKLSKLALIKVHRTSLLSKIQMKVITDV